jgi:hypothetical protein
MKRTLTEIFKYIDLTTWYSCIQVNKLWFSAASSNEIISKLLQYDTYNIYLINKNTVSHYFYTTNCVFLSLCFGYPLFEWKSKHCAYILDETPYKKLSNYYKIIRREGTFIFHKITVKDLHFFKTFPPKFIFRLDNCNTKLAKYNLGYLLESQLIQYGVDGMAHNSFNLDHKYAQNNTSVMKKYILFSLAFVGLSFFLHKIITK